MPKEAKKRGRRAEKARKQAQARAQADAIILEGDGDGGEERYAEGGGGGYADEEEFYGLLTEQEQEYFRQTDGVLDANAFSTSEGFLLFPSAPSSHPCDC